MNILAVYFFFHQQLDPLQPSGTNPPMVLGDTWTLMVMVLKMCLMLGAICLLAFVVLRYGLPRLTGLQSPTSNLMRVVSRFPLETNKSLYIVEVTGKHLLLGVTQERIEVLSELTSESIQEALDAAAVTKPSPIVQLGTNAVKGFSKYLRR